jgi:hypothetical protein
MSDVMPKQDAPRQLTEAELKTVTRDVVNASRNRMSGRFWKQ